jgi:hypothetical protein
MADNPQVRDPKDPTVRTRLLWGGTVAGVAGICAVGVGMMTGVEWLIVAACALALLGMLVAWRGGILYETRGQQPPRDEVRELLDGGEHRGVSSSARVVGGGAQADATQTAERTQRTLAHTAARPPMRRLAAGTLLGVGAWLLLGQWVLGYPMSVAGQDNALRDVGFAVVLVLSALRLTMPNRSLFASGLCLVCGALLIASALLLPHDSTFVRIDEAAIGLAALALVPFTFS